MARYLKNHRRQIAGFAIPVFFLFLVGFLSFSIFPGWLKPSYGAPGAACSLPVGAPTTDAFFSPDCEVCNGELCAINTASNNQYQCGVVGGDFVQILRDALEGNTSSFSTILPNFSSSAQAQACPNGVSAVIARGLGIIGGSTDLTLEQLIYPACYEQCSPLNFTTTFTSNTTQVSISFPVPNCQASDTYCQGISGGDGSNECRTAVCIEEATPEASGNPTGCDFEYVDGTVNEDCQLCTDAAESDIPACGNGVCETDEDEDCSSCPVDCLLPGFEGTCPLTSGPEISFSCNPLPSPTPDPAVSAITFPQGPPLQNFPASLLCEDGDLCTDNACSADGSTCDATPKLPSGNTPDFCCPSGAAFPDSGNCGDLLGSNCDVDCYVPTECSANLTELSGTGCGSSLTGLDASSAVSGVWGLFSLIALALPMALRKRS